MTAEGSAITRLRRAIANPRASAMQIRAIVAELPGPVSLEDALAILLALIDREPETFPRAAAVGRLVLERRLPLVDAQLTLAALAALPGPGASAGAAALIELSGRSTGCVASTSSSATGCAAPADGPTAGREPVSAVLLCRSEARHQSARADGVASGRRKG
jgi:hypothetical protein